ncbi:MAG: hypothetical protein IKP67_08015 [Spirochaetales bacterium]|nr:hypothetical protein [Spirochaetales bacterium]
MSTKGGLIFLITSIVLVLGCIVALIGIYYFDWLKPANSGYTLYTATPDNDARFVINDDEQIGSDQTHAAILGTSHNESNEQPVQDKAIRSEPVPADNTPVISAGNPQKKYSYLNPAEQESQAVNTAAPTNEADNNTPKQDTVTATRTPSDSAPIKSAQPTVAAKSSTPAQTADKSAAQQKPSSPARTGSGNPVAPRQNMPAPRFTKIDNAVKPVPTGKDGSPIKIGFTFDKNRDFHSYGQYVSADEYKYRLAVINNLKIKTIVIDAVSQGNGISQEYYKVAYNANMIPAKILDEIVTSKEFRSLIPKQYLDIEEKMAAFPKGGKVTFSNTDMKELLILWSQGKLTPTQKAWQVKAAM